MTWTYRCPYCNSAINPDETVILVAQSGPRRFMIGFHPQPGNYTLYLPGGINIEKGERFQFFCAVCQRNLHAEGHNNLSCLDIIQGPTIRKLLFSNIAGEHATYVVKDSEIEASHGDNAGTYTGEFPKPPIR